MSELTSDVAEPAPAPAANVRVRIFGRTDVGMVREHNEDNFLIADLSARLRSQQPEVREHTIGARGTLFAVCDGMGGAAAGEVASQMAVDTIHELIQNGPEPASRDQFAQRLSYAIGEAGARIFLAAKSNRAQRGMGTTSTVAGVYGKTLFVGQVGDSRAYMVRAGKIKQLTRDQSLVWKLIEAGQLTEAEAESYEHSHIILQALGTADTVSVDLTFVDLCKGDVVMVCSDGLSGLVTADQMREVLTTSEEPVDACKRLTDLANAGGGHDNITVIVARFDGDLPPVGPDDEVFGYQPYVITEPMDHGPVGRASGKIKGADLPPPGKDVKNAVSMRPPAMNGGAPAAVPPSSPSGRPPVPADDDEDYQLPVSNTPRVVLAIVLIALALCVLGVAGWLLVRKSDGGGDAAPGARPPAAESRDARGDAEPPAAVPATAITEERADASPAATPTSAAGADGAAPSNPTPGAGIATDGAAAPSSAPAADAGPGAVPGAPGAVP